MLNVKTFNFNFVEENCYVLSDATLEAVIVDCGAFFPGEFDRLAEYIRTEGLRPTHLLQTHGHFDHVFGCAAAHEAFGLSPELSRDEVFTYEHAGEQMAQFIHRALPLPLPPVGTTFADGDVVTFGEHRLRVIATPGHTPGGVCFYCEEERLLLSGDSLFCGAIGRCDLPGGNETALVEALRTRVLTLPDDVRVLPGHGEATTVVRERTANPYLA